MAGACNKCGYKFFEHCCTPIGRQTAGCEVCSLRSQLKYQKRRAVLAEAVVACLPVDANGETILMNKAYWYPARDVSELIMVKGVAPGLGLVFFPSDCDSGEFMTEKANLLYPTEREADIARAAQKGER